MHGEQAHKRHIMGEEWAELRHILIEKHAQSEAIMATQHVELLIATQLEEVLKIIVDESPIFLFDRGDDAATNVHLTLVET